MRSSAKPFQAQALFLSGAKKRFDLNPAELALTCASHDGTLRQLELIQTFLAKLGLDQSYLACGTHLPAAKETRDALAKSGQTPRPIHNNCSGKHTGMLAAALALGAALEGYEKPDHPVQQLNFQTFRALSGVEDISFGIDGCSVPTFILPLANAARMFAQLAVPQTAPEKYQQGLEQTFRAMRTHPDLVAGPESLDTVLMQTIPGLAAKGGAEGYYGMALRESPYGPLGIAFKVEDGSSRARDVFGVALLEKLGLLASDLDLPWRRPVLKNHQGIETGYLEASFGDNWLL
jgi:L-asparaginase II